MILVVYCSRLSICLFVPHVDPRPDAQFHSVIPQITWSFQQAPLLSIENISSILLRLHEEGIDVTFEGKERNQTDGLGISMVILVMINEAK